jgi:hypothetical protein
MSSKTINELLVDDDVRTEVLNFWANIFRASNEIIRQSNIYGFLSIGVIPDPNIHQILKSIKIIDDILDEVLSDLEDSEISTEMDTTRLIQNAKQQLLIMENLALSLKHNDEKSYNENLEALKRQAVF